jgi:hypothetical protein
MARRLRLADRLLVRPGSLGLCRLKKDAVRNQQHGGTGADNDIGNV